MLRVMVEMVPCGDEKRKRTLGIVEIANLRTTEDGYASYRIQRFSPADGFEFGETKQIERYDRTRGWWELVMLAFRKYKAP